MRTPSKLSDLAVSALLLFVSAGCATPTSGTAPLSTPVPASPGTTEPASHPSAAPGLPPPAAPPAREAAGDPDRSDSDLIASYTPIWRAMLADKNGVSPADVDANVQFATKTITRSEAGISLSVYYRFALAWATVDVRDEVIVRVDSRHPYASSLGGKLDRWLSASEVAIAAGTPSAPTKLARLPFGKHPKFASLTAARAALSGPSHTTFDEERVSIGPAWISDRTPNLFLTGITPPLPPHKQECARVHLDLVTGEVQRDRITCALVF